MLAVKSSESARAEGPHKPRFALESRFPTWERSLPSKFLEVARELSDETLGSDSNWGGEVPQLPQCVYKNAVLVIVKPGEMPERPKGLPC
jgi:hypothetical protein